MMLEHMSSPAMPKIMPFLWVHGEDEATYRKMVGVIYDANLRAFCVEARPHDGFCQAPWWRDMDIILDEAERRGMKVWILDDKHFPTGFAAGQAAKAPLELRRQGLLHKVYKAKGRVILNLTKEAHPHVGRDPMYLVTNLFNKNLNADCKFDDDKWFSVTAIRTDNAQNPIDLSGFVQNGILSWTAPEGTWQIHLCYLSRNIGSHRSYINMMDETSCRIQIEAVYEPHYAHYKDKFGKVIVGFFSDEPELGNNRMYKMYNILGTEQDLPWSRELEVALKERLGSDMPALLPLLWSNDADVKLTAKIRYTFMDCVSRLVEKDFSKQLGEWCREHGVDYIGHVVEDNNQHARTGTSLGHYFRGLKWQTMSGIDDIGGQVEPGCENRQKKNFFGFTEDGEFYHYMLGKLGSSMAALNPRMMGRAMCEIFGNYGWREGVMLEKYLLDHFMVRGINHFVPHAFTCSAYPEKDCPPHFYAQGNNPQYRHFGELMKYAARVCDMISDGASVLHVALLYHAEAEWCGKAMLNQKPARVLLDNQIDFNIIPADVFAEPEFYKTELTDVLTVNGHKHDVLVVPYSQFITRETAQAIEILTQKGGKILFIDALPDGLCTGEDIPDALQKCKIIALDDLSRELRGYKTLDLTPANNRVRAMYYVGKQEFYYLFNEGQTAYRGTVTLPEGEYYFYDAWHDRNQSLDVEGGKVQIELPPLTSALIICGMLPDKAWIPAPRGEKLLLTNFKQSVCRAIEYPLFGGARFISALDSYAFTDPKFSGIIRYETSFSCPAQTLEITEAYEGVEVFVNGTSLGIQVTAPFVYDLRGLVKDGENRLTIEVSTTLERERSRFKINTPTGITGDVALYL